MNFTVGQVPVQPLSVTLVSDTGGAVDLTLYDRFELALTAPEGGAVDTSAGVTSVAAGKVRYSWPSTTLFATPGDYSAKLKCIKGTAVDWTEAAIIEVYGQGI